MRLAAFTLLAPLGAAAPDAAQAPALKPGPKDLCPVCGMIVAKYPNWVASVVWKDGQAQHFDGAKDMFKFLQALPRYAPKRKPEDFQAIAVTEFYDLKSIDARQAFFVTGSDVMGPMGHELILFAARADAEEFRKDHRGKRILRFEEVTAEVVARVDGGRE